MKKRNVLFVIIFLVSFLSLNGQNIKIEIKTELGSVIAELYPDKAPITCTNFIKYIDQNKLDGASFYRVVRMDNQPNNEIKIEVIQGGLGFDVEESPFPRSSTKPQRKPEYYIKKELYQWLGQNRELPVQNSSFVLEINPN